MNGNNSIPENPFGFLIEPTPITENILPAFSNENPFAGVDAALPNLPFQWHTRSYSGRSCSTSLRQE
jgi:hypothetical protein